MRRDCAEVNLTCVLRVALDTSLFSVKATVADFLEPQSLGVAEPLPQYEKGLGDQG